MANKIFYEMLSELSKYTVRASDMLRRTFYEFNYDDIRFIMMEIHEIENEADAINHNLQKALEKQYIIPMRREDIALLGQTTDAVVDSIEDVIRSFYMYDIKKTIPQVEGFIDIIENSCKEIFNIMSNMKNPKSFKSLEKSIELIRSYEDQADGLYIKANKELFDLNNPDELIKWEELIFRLEKCCDTCKNVADTVNNIFLRYN